VDPEVFGRYDAVVLATAHDAFKEGSLYRKAGLVVDTRNVVAPALGGTWSGRPRLVKA
jgi:UDP-N-acetyl-D-glucosamine dehydrogenase